MIYLISSLTFEILLRKELGGDPNWINITMEALRGLWKTLTGLGKRWTKMGGFWKRLCLKKNWGNYGKDFFILEVKQVGEWRISHLFPHPTPKVSFIVRHTAHNRVVGHIRTHYRAINSFVVWGHLQKMVDKNLADKCSIVWQALFMPDKLTLSYLWPIWHEKSIATGKLLKIKRGISVC